MLYKKSSHKNLVILSLLILALILVFVVLESLGLINFFHTTPKAITASSYTKGQVSTKGTSNKSTASKQNTISGNSSAPNTQPTAGYQKTNSGSPTPSALLAPSGDFVSAHQVTLNTPIVSVCTTTPGAECSIVFTASNGTQESLRAEHTDSGGSAYWNNWTPSSIGITQGEWKIRAVATLNGQTMTTQDAMNMSVAQ